MRDQLGQGDWVQNVSRLVLFLWASGAGSLLGVLSAVRAEVGIPLTGLSLQHFIRNIAHGTGKSEAEVKEAVEKVREEFSPERWVVEVEPTPKARSKLVDWLKAGLLVAGGMLRF